MKFYKPDTTGKLQNCGSNDPDVTAILLTISEYKELANAWRCLDKERQLRTETEAKHQNLLRVITERANADRGLRPKKDRSGYILVKSYYSDRDKYWVTVIQSPYQATMSHEWVKQQLKAALPELSKKLDTACFDYDPDMVANFQRGYWELEMYHKDPLGVVDPDLLPENKDSRQ